MPDTPAGESGGAPPTPAVDRIAQLKPPGKLVSTPPVFRVAGNHGRKKRSFTWIVRWRVTRKDENKAVSLPHWKVKGEKSMKP